MPLPEAVPEPAAAWLDDLPRETLEAMLAAGREVLEWRRLLAKTGDNVVGEVLKHEGQFYILDHYPKGHVFDPESHSQWYYHAHLLRLFRPQIEELLQQRDERIRAWQRAHPEVNTYEDRRLEVTSQLPVSVEAQVELLAARLG